MRLSNPRDGQSWFQSEEDAWLFIEAFSGLRDVDLSGFYEKFNAEVTPTLTN